MSLCMQTVKAVFLGGDGTLSWTLVETFLFLQCQEVNLHQSACAKNVRYSTMQRTNIIMSNCLEYLMHCKCSDRHLYMLNIQYNYQTGFPGGSEDKVSDCNAGDLGLIPGSGRSPGEGNGNPIQYSCLENPMDRGVWWATVHGVAKSWTQLSDFTQNLSLC